MLIAQNKKAYFDYTILDVYTAGLCLVGCEVKSIRAGQISLKESYIIALQGELVLIGCHIAPYRYATHERINPIRDRKLLLHKREIKHLIGKVAEKRLTLVPLNAHWSNNRVKLKLGLAQSKKLYDKRAALREKAVSRDAKRDITLK